MDTVSLADFGIIGLLMFMCFQYIIKPIIASLLDKRRGNPGTPCNSQEMSDMMKILTKCDDKQRPLVWGYCTKEAIEKLTKAVEELTAKLE